MPAQANGPPQRLDAEDPIITNVAGPCLQGWAGGYFWYVNYQLPSPAQTGGFIIQELYQQGSGGSQEHFWECWRVRSGETKPSNRSPTPDDVEPPGELYDDRYRHLYVPGSAPSPQGWYRHAGQARFYPGPLPRQFGTESPTVDSYISWNRPDGWTGAGTRHDCYAEWGRRSGARFRGLVAFAGWREYRAGDTVTDSRPRPSFAPGPCGPSRDVPPEIGGRRSPPGGVRPSKYQGYSFGSASLPGGAGARSFECNVTRRPTSRRSARRRGPPTGPRRARSRR